MTSELTNLLDKLIALDTVDEFDFDDDDGEYMILSPAGWTCTSEPQHVEGTIAWAVKAAINKRGWNYMAYSAVQTGSVNFNVKLSHGPISNEKTLAWSDSDESEACALISALIDALEDMAA